MTERVIARESAFVAHKCEKHIVLALSDYGGGSRENGPAMVYWTVMLSSVRDEPKARSYVRESEKRVLGTEPSLSARAYEDSYTTFVNQNWTPLTHPEWGCLDVVYDPWFYLEVNSGHGLGRLFDHVFEGGKVQFMAAGAAVFEDDIFLPRSPHHAESVFYIPYTLEGMGDFVSRVWYQRLLLMPEWKRRSGIYLRACEPERIVSAPAFAQPDPPVTYTEREPATWSGLAAEFLEAAAAKLRGDS